MEHATEQLRGLVRVYPRRLPLPETALQVVEAEARDGAGLVRLERVYWCVLGGGE